MTEAIHTPEDDNVISIVGLLYERSDTVLHALFIRMLDEPDPPEAA